MRRPRLRIAIFLLFIINLADFPAIAQQNLSADDIIKGLTKKPLTRGLNTPSLTLDQMTTLSNISHATRGITIEQRQELGEIVTDNKVVALDFEINFAFNSDRLDPKSMGQLSQLGVALNSQSLVKASFVVAGHTDASGNRDYNQTLSERRALSVKQFLVQNFSIDPMRLIVAGYGQETPKNKTNPYADENRRVQIINLGSVGGRQENQTLFSNSSTQSATNTTNVTNNNTVNQAPAAQLAPNSTTQVANNTAQQNDVPNDPLAPFDGSWITVNPPGSQVMFYKVAFGQRAASLPFGTAQIRLSDGTAGSNVKVSGEGFDCYYSVGFTSTTEMVWQLKQGDPSCSTSNSYKRLIQ